MTEAEWLTSTDLEAMLVHLGGRASERKLLLLGCAIHRPVLTAEEALEFLARAERFAEGEAELADWERTRSRNPLLALSVRYPWALARGGWGGAGALLGARIRRIDSAAAGAGKDPQTLRNCALLRDVFGNPFRPVAVAPKWLAWNHAAVYQLAAAIYAARSFEQLPVLADALQDAGCDKADLLAHCRQPGEHARGCWVVDLLLDKA
jgi:hypothetical protein